MVKEGAALGKLFESATKILLWVLTALSGVIAWQGQYVIKTVGEHDKRLTRVESTAYTVSNAQRDDFLRREETKEYIAMSVKPMAETLEIHIRNINDSLAEIKQAVKENRDARIPN